MAWTFTCIDARRAAAARTQFAAHLAACATHDSDLFGAELIFGELLANAVRHAPGPVRARVVWDVAGAVLHVEDLGPGCERDGGPAFPPPASDAGRGLALVALVGAELRLVRRDRFGTRASVRLPVRARTAPLAPETAADDTFERWECARWLESTAPPETGRHGIAQAVRHAAGAIALGEPQLFIDDVRWLVTTLNARGVDGTAIAYAIQAQFEALLPAAPRGTAHYLERLISAVHRLPGERCGGPDSALEGYGLAQRYVESLVLGDAAIDAFADAVLRMGVSRRILYLDVLARAQYESGRLWQLDQISIDQERRRTAATQRIMTYLRATDEPGPMRLGKIAAATAPGEEHNVGLQMVCDLARLDGWVTALLPPVTDAQDLVAALASHQPDVIALSATMAAHVAALLPVIAGLRAHPRLAQCAIVVGGAPFTQFPQLVAVVGADASAIDAEHAVDALYAFAPAAVIASTRAAPRR